MKSISRLLVFVCFINILISGCATESRYWSEINRKGTWPAYGEYLIRYPSGAHAEEATWQRARLEDLLESYVAYLKSYPRGKYTASANERIDYFRKDDLAWSSALRVGTVEAYEDYLKRAGGKHRDEAEQAIENTLWEKALQSDTLQAYGDYLSSRPHGKYADEARQSIAKKYPLSSEEVKNLRDLASRKPDEVKQLGYLDRLVLTGSDCLDDNANWTERDKG